MMHRKDPYSESGERSLDRISAEISPDGWSVSLDPVDPPWIRLRLNHPLSAELILTLDTGRNVDHAIDETLRAREFAIIRDAPRQSPRASLMRVLRQRSGAFGWTQETLGQVAEILRIHNLLTVDEASWLGRAGVPWAKE